MSSIYTRIKPAFNADLIVCMKINPRIYLLNAEISTAHRMSETLQQDRKIPPESENLEMVYILRMHLYSQSWDSLVGIASCYRLEGWGSIPGRGKNLFSIPQGPDRPRGQSSLLTIGSGGSFPGSKAAEA